MLPRKPQRAAQCSRPSVLIDINRLDALNEAATAAERPGERDVLKTL
jgi:hypothetical protein